MPTRFNRTFSAIRTLRRNWPQSYELSANCCSSFVFSRGNHSEQVTQLEEKADNYTGKPLKEDTTTHGPVSECSSVKHKGNMRKATNAENDSDDEDGLFASMLGNWGDKDDANVMNREFKQGDAHEGMEGLGSFSAAGGALLATVGALVVFSLGTAVVFGMTAGVSTLAGGKNVKSVVRDNQSNVSPNSPVASISAPLTDKLIGEDALRLELALLREAPRSKEVDARKAVIKAQLKLQAVKAESS
mmetsp:Transcript_21192/g.40468  ORF Transcript_21192/g.40468 Transcript_21192/m.40468 type:complete len:245 (-) Transcript_21192:202-936(-)